VIIDCSLLCIYVIAVYASKCALETNGTWTFNTEYRITRDMILSSDSSVARKKKEEEEQK